MAYETYYASCADILIDFERATLLATALAQRDEVDLVRCGDCGGLLLIDLLAKATKAARLCEACKLPDADVDISRYLNRGDISEPEQMLLFDGPGLAEPSKLNGSPANARSTEAEAKNHGSAPAVTTDTTSIPDTPEPSEDS